MKTIALIGTYTQPILFGTGEILNGHGDGIYVMELQNGHIIQQSVCKTVNASYLTINHSKNRVYCTNELKEYNGKEGGSVSSFALDIDTGKLVYQNTQPVYGTDPCHVAVSNDDKVLYCANFMSGSVTVLPIDENGALKEPSAFVQHSGHSINVKRQQGPHAHGVFFSPDSNFLFVPDLGIDTIVCYHPEGNKLIHIPENNISASNPGDGPRHLVFHPSGKFVFVNNEMDSSVLTYAYDSQKGKASFIEKYSTIPQNTDPDSTSGSAIKIHPNGRFLYVSNRGHDSIAIFKISTEDGKLDCIDIVKTGGKIPRDFEISPDGSYMLVAHQSSDDIMLFTVNQSTGLISKVERYEIPTPICVKFCTY